MSYFAFHLTFILPPILILAVAQRQPMTAGDRKGMTAWIALGLIVLLALVYTTPWDNYLVWREVWNYGIGRVVGTIGYVPIEEYLFFILQPILTGLWLYWLFATSDQTITPQPNLGIRVFGTLLWLGISIAGGLMLQSDPSVYLGLILAWAGPIVALQWGVGATHLWAAKRLWLVGTLVPTLYLWIADRIAIGQGIWSISETYTTGVQIFGLPIEEATFFLITNLMVVQGLLLVLMLSKTIASSTSS